MRAVHKVLVVDDDPVIAKSFDRVLSTKGYAVITAESGTEALKKLAAEDYDVVYTDIRMPGMSGLEVAEQVKAQRPWTPVVIITGYGNAEHEARARAAGVAAFLNKPLSPDMIEESAVIALHKAGAVAPKETAPSASAGWAQTIKTAVSAALGGLAFVIAFPVVALASLAWLLLNECGRHAGIRAAARQIKNIGLLVVSPFIAAACMAALPMVGGYALVALAKKTAGKDGVRRRARRRVRTIGLALAAPFTALVGIDTGVGRAIAAPFVGLAYIAYPAVVVVTYLSIGVKAWIAEPA